MNSVNLVGRLVRDPELRHTPSGDALCEIRLAVDRAGGKQDDGTYAAGFFDVTFWGKKAEVVAQYVTKGRQLGVTGELRFREWEDRETGKKRNAVSVFARDLTFVGSRSDEDEHGQRRVGASDADPPSPAESDFGHDFGGPSTTPQPDDDIPF